MTEPRRPFVLVFPPLFEPELPYLSVPALAASLRAGGWPVIARDANLEAHEALLAEDFQTHCLARARAALARLEERDALAPADFARYEELVRVTTAAPETTEQIPWALDTLRDQERAFRVAESDRALRLVQRAMRLVAVAYWPAKVQYGEFQLPALAWHARGLLAAATERRQNPFPDLFERSGMLDALARVAADAVGVGLSVVDSEQLVPALSLSAGLRARLPGVKLVLGGPYLTKLVAELERSPELFDAVDAVVVGEGETPLRALLESWEGERAPAEVPNLVYRDEESGAVRVNRPFGVEDVRALPPPDFSDLPLARYWSPEPVLPLLASRGCYWARCTFCAHSYIYRRRFSTRRPDAVAADMAALAEKYGTRSFFFTDEGLPPPFVRRLAAALHERLPSALWGIEARFEKGFDRETLAAAQAAGLRLIVFGLESFNERVLEKMAKGVRREDVRRIVDDCVDLGIAVHLWAIAGFPTEELGEAMETLDFVFGHQRLTTSPDFAVGLNRFALTRHCPVELDPEAYDITVPARREDEAFLTVSRFAPGAGMSEDELDEVFFRFDLLERSLPPDIRRTGRVYHMLRRDRGAPPPVTPDEPGPVRLAVRRSRFDLVELARHRQAGDPTPLPALSRPLPSLGVDVEGDRVLLLQGGLRQSIDRALADGTRAVLRLGPGP